MRTLSRTATWCFGLSLLLFAVVLGSATIGPVGIDYPTVAKAVLNAIAVPSSVGISAGSVSLPILGSVSVPAFHMKYTTVFSFDVSGQTQFIVGDLRLPRIVLGATVGFALAAAGTVMQGFFRNPMADPSIIGVSSGAAVAAVATIAFPAVVPLGLRPAAFLGALIAAFGVYLIATQNGRTPVATLLLAGVAIQTFLGAITSYLLVRSGESLREAMYWLMGNLHNATWGEVELALPPVLLSFGLLLAFSRDLNVLLLGEEDAHTLGVAVERTKRLLLGLTSLITAAAVAVSGVIGFVGLIVPHAMRLVVGPDHRILLPTSALAGASFLVAADTIARSGAVVLPVGIVTAFVGAPFFLYLLRDREVHAL